MKRRINPVVVVCMLIAAVTPSELLQPDHAPHSYQETDGFD